jgi:DNA (cytosine-5)-methyltransferase 1
MQNQNAGGAYYNEIEPYAAEWLRNIIRAGHIAPGDVDERSIGDVHPDDLRGYTQCHFFAGIGVWSLALRRAGWADDRPVWTGSCPCQPFSAAGQGAGFADERHLWPHFHWLISECRPAIVLGEQVASKDTDPWIDLVQDDLEAVGYAVGAVPFPSAGVGAPHIRDRLYWVANANGGAGGKGVRTFQGGLIEAMRNHGPDLAAVAFLTGWPTPMAGTPAQNGNNAAGNNDSSRKTVDVVAWHLTGWASPTTGDSKGRDYQRSGVSGAINLALNGMAKLASSSEGSTARQGNGVAARTAAGPTNGHWRDADWLFCRDGKWRPVEPGTFPLAHGAAARVGRLRAYGNAINAEAARVFIEAVMRS